MIMHIPQGDCYIKSENDNYYRNEDTITIVTPSKASSVLLKIHKTEWGDWATSISMLDKDTHKSIINMSADDFINLMEGKHTDYEVLNNKIFLVDDNGYRIEPGDVVVDIFGVTYILESACINEDKFLYDGNGSGKELKTHCTLSLQEVEDNSRVLADYIVNYRETGYNDATVIYELTNGPIIKKFKSRNIYERGRII